jgi:isopentenyl diphosphate isomerase/L-lactate dehydrogenase-like FMN-dependent dehydrogenase
LVYGLATAGEAGVGWVLDNFLAELDLTLALAGCASPAQLTRDHLRTA